jgi:hypothetical protein
VYAVDASLRASSHIYHHQERSRLVILGIAGVPWRFLQFGRAVFRTRALAWLTCTHL